MLTDLSKTVAMRLLIVSLAAVPLTFLLSMVDAKTVEYTWTLRPRRAQTDDPSFSPDCNLDKVLLLVNDEFPGPPLYASVGDLVKVTMINESPTEALALHFHGLTMMGQPYADGAASVTQCASGPMQTQVYEFTVSDSGTHYWHGHLSMERADGFQGPIIIYDPENDDEKQLEEMYDGEEVVFLQDWYHLDGQTRRTGLDSIPFIWIGNAQTFLINGGGIYTPCFENATAEGLSCVDNCSVENYIKNIDVDAGKTYRLRIIGGAELIGVNFAIQSHKMTVVEVEGTIVVPYEVENLDIMPGQRYSVLVTADQEPGNYWATTSVRYRSEAPTGFINFRYSGAAEGNLTFDGDLPFHPEWNDTQPTVDLESNLFTKTPSSFEDNDVLNDAIDSIRRIIIVGTQAKCNVTGLLRWTANNITMTMSSVPIITMAYDAVNADGSASWPSTEIPGTLVVPDVPPTSWNYSEPVQDSVGEYYGDRGLSHIALTEGDIVEVVLQNVLALNGVAEMHSWHLHGHSFYVVGAGIGTFDEEADPASYNLDNPVRRDTVAVLPFGWTAIRFKANNPGAWLFHCTQPAHVIMGMGFNFIVSPDKLEEPPQSARSCVENSMVRDSDGDNLPSENRARDFLNIAFNSKLGLAIAVVFSLWF